MKALIPIIIGLLVVGCGGSKEEKSQAKTKVKNPESTKATVGKLIIDPIVENVIRIVISKPIGELTKVDLEKVTIMSLPYRKLTDVPKGLEKLTQLESLNLGDNPYTAIDDESYYDLQNWEYFDWEVEQLKKYFPEYVPGLEIALASIIYISSKRTSVYKNPITLDDINLEI